MTGKSKLSDEVKLLIRTRNDEGVGVKELAREFSVHRDTIARVIGNGRFTPDSRLARSAVTYGVTIEWVRTTFAAQGGCCAICRNEFESIYSVFFEHDNECCHRPNFNHPACGNCIRSLTCLMCNSGLGFFKHDPELLRSAALYLEVFKCQ